MPTLIFAGDQDYITPLKLFLDSPDFQRENILIREIDNPQKIKKIFDEYCQRLQLIKRVISHV